MVQYTRCSNERRAYAGVMELADVTDSKSVDGDIVWVRVPPPAPKTEGTPTECPLFLMLLMVEKPLQTAGNFLASALLVQFDARLRRAGFRVPPPAPK